jgi:hypothetical protein
MKTFTEKHRAFVRDIVQTTKQEKGSIQKEVSDLLRRLLKISRGNSAVFQVLVKRARPALLKILVQRGKGIANVSAQKGRAFAAQKLAAQK